MKELFNLQANVSLFYILWKYQKARCFIMVFSVIIEKEQCPEIG